MTLWLGGQCALEVTLWLGGGSQKGEENVCDTYVKWQPFNGKEVHSCLVGKGNSKRMGQASSYDAECA